MKLTTHTIHTAVPCPLTLLVAADLHGRDYQNAMALVASVRPDLILCPGDMAERTDRHALLSPRNQAALAFMEEAATMAPLYYSLGNHEGGMTAENRVLLNNADIHLLDNTYVTLDCGVVVGGLTSGYAESIRQGGEYRQRPPSTAFLRQFAAEAGFKILLCHHPEYYEPYIRPLPVELTVSGHAHGGQWRLFGRGIFAPGQGFLPRYTAGVHENRLAISCGMANTVAIPRFFNPRELVLLRLIPSEEGNPS